MITNIQDKYTYQNGNLFRLQSAGGEKAGNIATIVKETRTSNGNTRRRRLECANEHRFTTLETIVVRKTPIRQKQKTPKASGGA